MLKKVFCGLFISASLLASASTPLVDVQIDTTLSSSKVVPIDGKVSQADVDSLQRKLLIFYYDQFRHFQDPGAPYFLFLSKDANLAMGIGGAVKMRGYIDWGGAMPSSGFAPYQIPMNPNPARMNNLDMTPSGTSLFFRVLGNHKTLGEYQLYIEANFNGYKGRDFHLKKAYASLNDFTLGYTSSTFSDPASVAPTVDSQGPNNKVSHTTMLVRYMPVVKDKWYFAVSAEMPEQSVGFDNKQTADLATVYPDGAAFVQYQWARGQHVRLAGIVRALGYRDLITSDNHRLAGWGLQLSQVSHPLHMLTLYANVNYGQGIAGLSSDLKIGKYDLVSYANRPGHMYAPASFGWSGGIQYNFKPHLFMSVSASGSHYYPKHPAAEDEYRYGTFGCVNLFWNPTPRVQLATEFDFGQRTNVSGEQRWARRVGAMCQFSF